MTKPAIKVEGLWKEYVVGHAQQSHTTFYDLLGAAIKSPFRALRGLRTQTGDTDKFWALRDVSFEVQPGEVVGVIGRNGAGKSTLLKILSRITAPTKGRIEVRGRLASLLEVGTGFHPELSGRENIYLNGAILGMTRKEVARKFDEIVAFAEIEKFVDTPVKRYSSGMYVRLAFAVAAHLEPDILVVDEVLAVGDAQFQKRCLGKMSEVAIGGRTILFVSHNMQAVQSLCASCIWIENGGVKSLGSVDGVVPLYLRADMAPTMERIWLDKGEAPGNEKVRIRRISVFPADKSSDSFIDVDSGVEFTFEYWNFVEGARLNLSIHVFTDTGILVLNTVPLLGKEWFGQPFSAGLYRSVCVLPKRLLNAGGYRIELLVVQDQNHVIYRDEYAALFEVADVTEEGVHWHGRWAGVVRPMLAWQTSKLDSDGA